MKFLLPFAWLYALGMQLRNKFFDWGVLKSVSVGVPVISVGNLTVGGTGKTPLVEYIVRHFLAKNLNVAIVSRGYKRKTSGVVVVSDGKKLLAHAEQGGDEPVQIAAKFPEAIVVVGEKRVQAARRAEQLGAQVIVLDDGFQHRYLQRDLDIVVIDSTNDIAKEFVLPAGRLRESFAGLKRANVVALSKVDETVLSQSTIEAALRRFYAGPLIKYAYRTQDVRRAADGGIASLDIVRRMRLLAFSGIGKHETFLHALTKNGFTSLTEMRFPDHHAYSGKDVETLTAFAKAMMVDACITTEKDVVRLSSNTELSRRLFDEIPVFYLNIEVEFLGGKEILDRLIDNCLKGDVY